MTDINHRRRNRKPVNQRHLPHEYHNGWAPIDGKQRSASLIGRTDYLDKSSRCWGAAALISGKRFLAGITDDFTDGHRGMARAVRGAKRYVRTRVRFHDNAATRALALEARCDGRQDDDGQVRP